MKKVWIELRRGEVVEVSGIRSVSAGEQLNTDFAEGNRLYLRFVGDRKVTNIVFATKEEKWEGYNRLKEALKKLAEAPAK
jgi:hypothetical protein